jgi:hypothetical protein
MAPTLEKFTEEDPHRLVAPVKNNNSSSLFYVMHSLFPKQTI